MRDSLTLAIAIGLLATGGANATAQDPAGVVAWFAMAFTPYGALPPLVSQRMAGGTPADEPVPSRLEARYGQWAFDGDDRGFSTIGIGGRVGDFGFGGGYEQCGGCDGRITGDGVVMAGIDYEFALRAWTFGSEARQSQLSIGLRPAGGIGFFTDVTKLIVLSGTVDIPVAATIPMGSSARVVPFLSPGVGIGRVADRGESRKGARPTLAAGLALMAANGLGLHVGWRRLFPNDVPATVGVGLTFEW